MKNVLIALRGVGNSGKTQTLRQLYNHLQSKKYNIEQVFFDNLRLDGKGDFGVLIQINGVMVGLTSIGDTYYDVSKNLIRFADNKAAICICACRTFDVKGLGTNHAIEEFAKRKKSIVEFYEKKCTNSPSLQADINSIDCRTILDALISRC